MDYRKVLTVACDLAQLKSECNADEYLKLSMRYRELLFEAVRFVEEAIPPVLLCPIGLLGNCNWIYALLHENAVDLNALDLVLTRACDFAAGQRDLEVFDLTLAGGGGCFYVF